MTDLIVDGNSLFARSWFAASKYEPDPLNSMRLALVTILSILDLNTDKLGVPVNRILFCWDGPNKPSKGRAPKPPEYYDTLDCTLEAFTTMLGTAHATVEHYEGDDVVATAVFRSQSDSVYVISGDKDLTQLVGGKVRYYCLNQKAVLSHPYITEKWHIKQPNQVAIALAIIGDKVDNIPGIPKWGPVRVKKVFSAVTPEMDFEQALDTVLAQVPEALQPTFFKSLEAVMLNPGVPNVPEPAQLVFAETDVMAAMDLPNFMPTYERTVRSYYLHGESRESGYSEVER